MVVWWDHKMVVEWVVLLVVLMVEKMVEEKVVLTENEKAEK